MTCMLDVLSTTVGNFVCKFADAQLVYDFSALNRGPKPVHVILFFFQTYPYYARVGNSQPFARIHKSRTVLFYNVVLGLMVERRNMSSVDSAYTLSHTHICTRTHTHTHRHTHTHSLVHLTCTHTLVFSYTHTHTTHTYVCKSAVYKRVCDIKNPLTGDHYNGHKTQDPGVWNCTQLTADTPYAGCVTYHFILTIVWGQTYPCNVTFWVFLHVYPHSICIRLHWHGSLRSEDSPHGCACCPRLMMLKSQNWSPDVGRLQGHTHTNAHTHTLL